MNVIAFGVVPRVMNRFIGFVAYRTDQQPAQLNHGGRGGCGRYPAARCSLPSSASTTALWPASSLASSALVMIGGAADLRVKQGVPVNHDPSSATAEMQRWVRFTPARAWLIRRVLFVMVGAIAWTCRDHRDHPRFLYDAPNKVVDMGSPLLAARLESLLAGRLACAGGTAAHRRVRSGRFSAC